MLEVFTEARWLSVQRPLSETEQRKCITTVCFHETYFPAMFGHRTNQAKTCCVPHTNQVVFASKLYQIISTVLSQHISIS